jgi:hypothetical protein
MQMITVYTDLIKENLSLGLVGQPLSNVTFDEPSLDFYKTTQIVSEALDINTPSNLHGHFSRGALLFGIPGYLAILVWFLRKSLTSRQDEARLIILAVVVVSSITQSIFSHPFTGSYFAMVCITGFCPSSKQDTLIPSGK